MNAKICDFGLSKIRETATSKGHTHYGGQAGTLQYKSPESFDGDFGTYSDVYAFGCVIFECLNGKRPWDGLADTQIVKKVLVDKVPLDFNQIRQDTSSILIQIMKQCLDYDKNKRPSF